MFAPSQANKYTGAGKFCSLKCKGAAVAMPKHENPTRYRKEDRAWRRAVLDRDRHICQRCGGPGNIAHHLAGRVGALRHLLSNGMTLCNRCHTWCHAHPTESYEAGWMIKRND